MSHHRASGASTNLRLRSLASRSPDVGTSLRADARPGNLGGELSDRGAILAVSKHLMPVVIGCANVGQ